MIVGTLFFSVCTLVCLVGGLSTVLAKSPIRSAVGLLVTIFGIAGLYLQLTAQFLAAIQLIVYAGAVVVLFVFVIMLLGPDATVGESSANARRSRPSRLGGVAVVVVLGVGGLGVLRSGEAQHAGESHATQFEAPRADHGTLEAVGGQLFTTAMIPFEITTALLIVAVVGAIAVAKNRQGQKPTAPIPHATRRLFHGPLHPRDVLRKAAEEVVR